MAKIYGYIYLTTNLKNNKKYIGQHKGNKLDTNYFGSGRLISQALQKYGKYNFKCEILDIAYSKEELDNKEIYWIAKHNAVLSDDYYNLAEGGVSTGRELGHNVSDETRAKLRKANLGKTLSDDVKLKISRANKGKHCGDKNSAKLDISRAKLKIANHGSNNPAYGKHWFTNGIEIVYTYECPEGFRPGRGKTFSQAHASKISGRHWYNNGIISIQSYECPNGFVKGRL